MNSSELIGDFNSLDDAELAILILIRNEERAKSDEERKKAGERDRAEQEPGEQEPGEQEPGEQEPDEQEPSKGARTGLKH